jgi:hypothetical protein
MSFKCGHSKTKANTAVKSARGRDYETCRQCQNMAQRRHQRAETKRTGKSQWARRSA